MSSRERAIKYAAMFFGILLAAVIIGGAAMVVLGVTGSFGGDKGRMDFEEEFPSSEIKNFSFENLSGKMEVMAGDRFYVEAKDVPEDCFYASVEKGTLTVGYSKKQRWGFRLWGMDYSDAEITITIPEDFWAGRIEISNGSGAMVIGSLGGDKILLDNGSGRMEVEGISGKELELSSGSGPVVMKEVLADSMGIDSGSGNVSIDTVDLKGLEFSGGSGDFEMSGRIDGNLEIDSGSGRVTISLKNAREEYNIDADTGSGALWLDGDKKQDYKEKNQGAGYDIDINSGSGRVSIEFSKGK